MPDSFLSILRTLGPRRASRMLRLHLKETALSRDPWFTSADTAPDNCIIVGGSGRSGTTLLREMLDRHPAIACGPESGVLCDFLNPRQIAWEWGIDEAPIRELRDESPSMPAFASRFFSEHASREGKLRWADKTPRNVRNLHRILRQFPNAKFIHIIRDGRDVACSLRHHPKEKIVNGKVVPTNIDRAIWRCARRWRNDVASGLAYQNHPRVYTIKYEDLIESPERTLRALCEFIEEPFAPEMLEPTSKQPEGERFLNNRNAADAISSRSIARWKRDLSQSEREDVARIAGELLITLGYADSSDWVHEPADHPAAASA